MIARILPLAALVLAGCVTQPVPPQTEGLVRSELQALAGFELDGRIGVSHANEGFNGSLNWRQIGDHLTLGVHGPLGVGRTELSGDSGGVEIRASDGTVQNFADPGRALLEVYGWTLPIESLRFWVLSVPRPGPPEAELTLASILGAVRVDSLSQDGWRVDYEQYRPFNGQVLPRKLVLHGGSLRVRLVVKNWRLHGVAP